MNLKYAYCLLATFVVATVSNLSFAQASSIQIMPPSTSKIEVIGTVKKISPKPMVKKTPEKSTEASKPEIQAKPVAAIPASPQMRTREVELPVIQVNETKNSQ